jgi:hypothetical protein
MPRPRSTDIVYIEKPTYRSSLQSKRRKTISKKLLELNKACHTESLLVTISEGEENRFIIDGTLEAFMNSYPKDPKKTIAQNLTLFIQRRKKKNNKNNNA